MPLFDSAAYDRHESVHVFRDERAGLLAMIAIHSTALGPAAGGCRMWRYESLDEAMRDVLLLSRAMSFKTAIAGLDLGGGKAVIVGDSRTQKTRGLFEAFGRCVEQLGGRYWAAEDVGVSPSDMAIARESTDYVAGLNTGPGASGDPSLVTAEGVFRGIELAARRAYGRGMAGMTVAIQGVGHVGACLAEKLHAEGASLVIADVDPRLTRAVAERTGARIVESSEICDAPADVFSPCALGGTVSMGALARLKGKVIAGAANNQLAHADVGRAIMARNMIYAPDYVINGGGIINVASEIHARRTSGVYDREWVEGKLVSLMQTLDETLERSDTERRPSNEIADDIAKARISLARPD